MRMLTKALLVVVVLSMGLADLTAREGDWSVTFSYNMATPTGRTGEFIDRYSWSGFGGDIAYWFDDHNTVGVTSGWQRFDAFYRDLLVNIDGGAVFGSQVRYVTSVPLLVTATHYMGDPIDKIKAIRQVGCRRILDDTGPGDRALSVPANAGSLWLDAVHWPGLQARPQVKYGGSAGLQRSSQHRGKSHRRPLQRTELCRHQGRLPLRQLIQRPKQTTPVGSDPHGRFSFTVALATSARRTDAW